MAFPQLSGRVAGRTSTQPPTAGILIAVFGLALLISLVGWRFLPAAVPSRQPSSGDVQTAVPAPVDTDSDRQLRLAHAEQRLVNAQEQLVQARRLLSVLSSDLRRNYLQAERRRADAVWTTCEGAQRLIEEAISDIKAITTGKD